MEDSFSTDQERGGDGLGMIQAHYACCALYFYCYYISSTSDHQVLDPGGWGPWSKGSRRPESLDLNLGFSVTTRDQVVQMS